MSNTAIEAANSIFFSPEKMNAITKKVQDFLKRHTPVELPSDAEEPVKLNSLEISGKSIECILQPNSPLNANNPRKESVNPTTLTNGEFAQLQKVVLTAIAERKIFAICRCFPALQKALVERGWLQKPMHAQLIECSNESSVCEYVAHTLKDVLPNLIWTKQFVPRSEYGPMTNISQLSRKRNGNFSLKLGLAALYENMHWFDFTEPGLLSFPRCYLTTNKYHKDLFLEDFRLTSCTSFLYSLSKKKNLTDLFSPDATITSECIVFAMEQVQRACDKKCHKDIDQDIGKEPSKKTFQAFNQSFRKILREQQRVKITNGISAEEFTREIQELVKEALKLFPHIAIDGPCNAWIVKPGCANRGIGIQILDDEDKIINFVRKNNVCYYVVQKYIERPLLIYNTKFDIRQYFIVTMDARSLNIWMYKNCYLKFSGQQFSLDNYTRSVHLTNHTVQKCYENGVRSPELPVNNMWSLQDFRIYLNKIGAAMAWPKVIYPGMINAIKSVINASLDQFVVWRNSFELYGADFLISNNFHPNLLEINASPDLSASTAITEHICAAVIEDMVKVVIDYPRNLTASTGDFEKVWNLDLTPDHVPFSNIFVVGNNLKVNKNVVVPPNGEKSSVQTKPRMKCFYKNSVYNIRKSFTNDHHAEINKRHSITSRSSGSSMRKSVSSMQLNQGGSDSNKHFLDNFQKYLSENKQHDEKAVSEAVELNQQIGDVLVKNLNKRAVKQLQDLRASSLQGPSYYHPEKEILRLMSKNRLSALERLKNKIQLGLKKDSIEKKLLRMN